MASPPEIPWLWQWAGLIATFFGTALSLFSLIGAWVSASRAAAARDRADLAWKAARRLGRVAQLAELRADMQELQMMIAARTGARILAAKCDRIKSQVSRFKTESLPQLTATEQEDLDLARSHLDIMSQVSNDESATRPNLQQLQLAFGKADEAIGRVAGSHNQQLTENVNDSV